MAPVGKRSLADTDPLAYAHEQPFLQGEQAEWAGV